ncbi:glycerophosphodiester phosphodiesterase family protein [Brevibacterium sp. FME17]|uniref:glycerophosphodiester phosphodiesterase family protein n=1 Tax=Brevibacterium sp. FME17 TaxID=2742606 RepID=UPI001D01C2A3|nr:glycerophosphodiester phosphodiesterase family protein [Brevibacterium sp. FME17]
MIRGLFLRPPSENSKEVGATEIRGAGSAGAESSRADGLPTKVPSSGHIVYEGNGASSQHYSTEFEARGIRGFHSSSGSGARTHIALQPVDERNGSKLIINGFAHKRARLLGFYARHKIDDTWIWLTEDFSWQEGAAGRAKLLVQPDQDVSEIGSVTGSNIVLEAQWLYPNGESANCGSLMFTNKLMAHALGGLNEASYHNTLAAFEHSLEAGHTYFEVDLSYTADERLVVSSPRIRTGDHNKPEKISDMAYERVMSLTSHGEPIMDARDLYELLSEHPQYCFEIDFHFVVGENAKKRIKSLLEDFNHDDETLSRLLIQVHTPEMHRDIDSVYRFEHYQYLVGMKMDRLNEAITYSLDVGICALALRWSLATASVVEQIKAAGLYILSYTAEYDPSLADALLRSGIDTVCTDHVTPRMLMGAEGRMGQKQFFVFYHSGDKDAVSRYSVDSDQLRLLRVKSGALEIRDSEFWINDGTQRLLPQQFTLQRRQFAGWKMRMKIDGKTHWYCSDGTFRTKKEALAAPPTERHLFHDQDIVPVISTVEGAKVVMVAQWVPTKRFARILEKWLPKRQ